MKTNHIKTTTFSIALAVSNAILTLPTFAANSGDPCSQDVPAEVQAAAGCGSTSNALPGVIVGIINAVIGISGLIAVVYIVVGGVQYMTSTGDPGKIEKAKKTILYAVIGMIVCVLAFAIVNFVIAKL